MKTLLKGQLQYMSRHFEVVGISSDGDCFEEMLREQGGIRGIRVNMTRRITPFQDLKALFQLIRIFWMEKPGIVHTHTPKAGLLGNDGGLDMPRTCPPTHGSRYAAVGDSGNEKENSYTC